MKLLKLVLLVLTLFFFTSCTTTEEDVLANEKIAFDADYLIKSKEFYAYNTFLNDLLNEEKSVLTEYDLEKFDNSISSLLEVFITNSINNTNFLELNKNEILKAYDDYYLSQNKSVGSCQIKCSQLAGMANSYCEVIFADELKHVKMQYPGNDSWSQMKRMSREMDLILQKTSCKTNAVNTCNSLYQECTTNSFEAEKTSLLLLDYVAQTIANRMSHLAQDLQ